MAEVKHISEVIAEVRREWAKKIMHPDYESMLIN